MAILIKNRLLFMVYGMFLGSIVGFAAWLFLLVVNIGIHFIWHNIPNVLGYQPYYTILVTTVGGVLVGLAQKHFGPYPRLMPEVMAEYKKTGRVHYKFIHQVILAALIALLFGASLGPEAALVGIIGGLCTWVGDRFSFTIKEMNALTEVGIGATLSIIFNAPLFGYLAPSENEKELRTKISKADKTIVYLATTLAGFSVFLLLGQLDNRGSFIVNFGASILTFREWLAFLPLACIGASAGYVYLQVEHGLEKIFHPFQRHKVALGILGGILLGVAGTFLPYTLFSGEHELKELVHDWSSLSFSLLFLSGVFKLFITAVCLSTGWRGGHIFPLIFSGACIGYALSIVVHIDPIASVAFVTTALLAYAMQKPIAVTLLLLMFFPINLLLPMLGAAVIGNAFPVSSMDEKL
ncbi:chloride channel protein [Priestia taiwanensis]|uniref:Chloride channel protein n=1 Tax=Priestia taiwanensis TaxID=1347902 RepID=A0A917ANS5_9BACI|nr:chloride channel protein [Priestia taiwanensis]MBM7362400.1 H+/Cl- antiporter ClcA [Priestia taiwanensis]GGE61967.1 chloride channel protein [Priestia taiwanensis]